MSLYFLVGMPGAGKTYWGRKIAERYAMKFTDLDEYIEQQHGQKIAAIFNTEGAAMFREKEQHHLENIIRDAKEDMIIACGGGTPCYHDNMRLMLQNGTVIYLELPMDRIISNIKKNENDRPIFADNTNIETQLSQLLPVREPIYKQAHLTLQANENLMTDFKQVILLCTDKH